MALNEPARLRPLPPYDPRKNQPNLASVFSMPSTQEVQNSDLVEATCKTCWHVYELVPLNGQLTRGQLSALASHAQGHAGVMQPGSIRRKR